MDSDVRRQEYQLVCEDREGLTANDGLIVMVFPRPKQLYNVEFSITVEVPYESFMHNAAMKRKFFDKLRDVFGDPNTDSIVLGNVTNNGATTSITWYNQTLSTVGCPDQDILRLRLLLVNDDPTQSFNKKFGEY